MATVTLELPADLCEQVRRKFAGESEPLEVCLVRLLEELVDDGSPVQAEEEKFLEDRLRGLGYLSGE